LFETIAR
jgi:hypothetical protein